MEDPKHTVQSRYPVSTVAWLKRRAEAQQRSVNWILNDIVMRAMREEQSGATSDPARAG